jgi:hypothetical protein
MPNFWEKEFTPKTNHPWTYSIGQNDDGMWFWTYFEFYIFETEEGLRFADFNRPSINVFCELTGEDGMGVIGIEFYETKDEMIQGIKDEMSTDEWENSQDDFNQFYQWAIEQTKIAS